jgi:anionic cell wall polymer biosynthesis LytR-Cps2A-Psr (LCP) family protein
LGAEGTDFARSKRQQLVIEAAREKILSAQTLANPVKITGLMNDLGKSLETDIPLDKVGDFYNMAKDLNQTNNIVLGDLGNGQSVLINPPISEYGQWVLIPPNGDFTQIQSYISNLRHKMLLRVRALVDFVDR